MKKKKHKVQCELSKPTFVCKRYNVFLKCVGENRGYKKFIDDNGNVHECIKFSYGRQKVCGNLNVTSYI